MKNAAVSQLAGEIAEKIDDYLVDAWGYATVQFKQKCESIISAALSEREEKVAKLITNAKAALRTMQAEDGECPSDCNCLTSRLRAALSALAND